MNRTPPSRARVALAHAGRCDEHCGARKGGEPRSSVAPDTAAPHHPPFLPLRVSAWVDLHCAYDAVTEGTAVAEETEHYDDTPMQESTAEMERRFAYILHLGVM